MENKFSDPSYCLFLTIKETEKTSADLRPKRIRSTAVSLIFHIIVITLATFFLFKKPEEPEDRIVVMISGPMFLPPIFGQKEGGGGGGGGKEEKLPPEKGRLPETTRSKQTSLPDGQVAPDPKEPQTLVPPENKDDAQKIITPIEILQDTTLPIGDIQAPSDRQKSAGLGSGGGAGTGQGGGSGSGSGAGSGTGSGGGIGGGKDGGIGDGTGPFVAGNGVIPPVLISQPKPDYTEEARKQRIEGTILLEAIVRRDGSVDSVKVKKSLGYGLDESAVKTITEKWKFRPGTLKGEKVSVFIEIEIKFKLL